METHRNSVPVRNRTLLKRIWGFLPVLFLIGIILLIGSLFSVIEEKQEMVTEERKSGAVIEKPPVNVIVLEMKPAVIRDMINLPGIMEPWTDLKLLSKIYGSVLNVPVSEGDFIDKGEVIATIDPQDYQIALDAARSAYDLAMDDLERTKTLYEKKLTSKAELDRLQSVARIRKAELDQATLQLSRCSIEAPISGIIRKLDVKPGLLLSVADPVAQILEINTLKGVVGIPESDVPAVQNIETVALTIDSLDNRRIEVRKHFLSASPENNAMLYRLELAVPNEAQTILPGMFVRAEIVKKTVENGLSVPLYSVVTRDKEQFVFIERDQVAHKRTVQLGILEGWKIQVIQGLEPGDRVIVEGHRSVEEGQKVNVVRALTSLDGAF